LIAKAVMTVCSFPLNILSILTASACDPGFPRMLFPRTTIVSALITIAFEYPDATSAAFAAARRRAFPSGDRDASNSSGMRLGWILNFKPSCLSKTLRRGDWDARIICGIFKILYVPPPKMEKATSTCQDRFLRK